MKYVFTGVSGCRNRGVEALLVSAIQGIREKDSEAKIAVVSEDRSYDEIALRDMAVPVLDSVTDLLRPVKLGLRRTLARRTGRSGERFKAFVRLCEETDVVIASGGDVFSSDYGEESLGAHVEALKIAKDRGKKIVLLGHSIGPFRSDRELALWKGVAATSQLITLRESSSYQYVRDSLGERGGPRLEPTADVAFCLQPAEDSERFFGAGGLPGDGPTIACALSAGIAGYSNVASRDHLCSWLFCLSQMVRSLGARIVLIPHVQEKWPLGDDSRACTEVLRALDPDVASRTTIVGGDVRAAEIKGLIGQCDMLIAERMHAGIAGLSSGIPTLVIGYSVKASGIIGDLYAGLDEGGWPFMPITEFLNRKSALRRIKDVWETREHHRSVLQERIPKSKAKAAVNFELLMEILKGHK